MRIVGSRTRDIQLVGPQALCAVAPCLKGKRNVSSCRVVGLPAATTVGARGGPSRHRLNADERVADGPGAGLV